MQTSDTYKLIYINDLPHRQRNSDAVRSGWLEVRLQPEKLDILNRKTLRLIRCPTPSGEGL